MFKSTLSIAFIACVGTVISIAFLHIEVDDRILGVLVSIITAYLTARNSGGGSTQTNINPGVVTQTTDNPAPTAKNEESAMIEGDLIDPPTPRD